MDRETKSILTWIGTCVLSSLMAGNIFFVKRLVDEIDSTKTMVLALDKKVSVLSQKLDDTETVLFEKKNGVVNVAAKM